MACGPARGARGSQLSALGSIDGDRRRAGPCPGVGRRGQPRPGADPRLERQPARPDLHAGADAGRAASRDPDRPAGTGLYPPPGRGRRHDHRAGNAAAKDRRRAGGRETDRAGPFLWRGGGAGLGGAPSRAYRGTGAGGLAGLSLGRAAVAVLPCHLVLVGQHLRRAADHRLGAGLGGRERAQGRVRPAGGARGLCRSFRPGADPAADDPARQRQAARGAQAGDHRAARHAGRDRRAGRDRARHRRHHRGPVDPRRPPWKSACPARISRAWRARDTCSSTWRPRPSRRRWTGPPRAPVCVPRPDAP